MFGEGEGAIAAKTDRVILSPGVVIFFAMKAPKVAIILLCLSKYIWSWHETDVIRKKWKFFKIIELTKK